MTVIIYFVLHVPSLKSLADPMGSLLARPLRAVPAVFKEAGFSQLKHFRTLFDYVDFTRSCLDPF